MVVLPAEAEVRPLQNLTETLRLLRVPATIWDVFLEQVGNPGNEICVVAALPPHIIVQAIGQAQVAGQGLSALEAAHVGAGVPSCPVCHVLAEGRSSCGL